MNKEIKKITLPISATASPTHSKSLENMMAQEMITALQNNLQASFQTGLGDIQKYKGADR